MAIKLSISVDGQKILSRSFRKVSDSLDDLGFAFKEAQKEFYQANADNFQSGNRTGASGSWQPRSERYEKSLKTFELLAGVERRSDKLYKALTKGADGAVTSIGKTEAVFGTDLPYAKAQHYGYKPNNLPARPLIDLSDLQIKRISKVMAKAIRGDVAKAGFQMTPEGFEGF